MSPFQNRLSRIASMTRRAAIPVLAAAIAAAPASAHETGMPHLAHEYEGWVLLAVIVLSLAAGWLVRRVLRR